LAWQVTALPENAEAGLASAFESALSPKITPHAVHELEVRRPTKELPPFLGAFA
jgi:hypothetical protein